MTEKTKQEDWEKFFPYANPRNQQTEAINLSLDAFKEGKKYVILEAGTGVGKSAVGYTIAKYMSFNFNPQESYKKGSYFLTTQKILQEQYMHDFSCKGMKSIKSSVNYSCNYYKNNTCAESMRALKTAQKGSDFWNACSRPTNCIYKSKKRNFLESTEGVTNFPYFLAETSYSGKLTPRHVLITDEAHNVEIQLSKFIEIAVTENFSKKLLKLDLPKKCTQLQAFNWIRDVYTIKLRSHLKHTEKILSKYTGLKEKIQEFTTLARQFELLDKHSCKINRFLEIYEKDNWVFNEAKTDKQRSRRFEFKPIDVAPYANDLLFKFGEFNILMSATIINQDHFCSLLGIKKEDALFISMPSPFPTENRPILAVPIGKMSAKEIDNSLPKLAAAVKSVLENHPNEKGIIHCHTYKIANYLKRNVRSSRLLIHNSENRDDILKKHKLNKRPTVLLSPSMTEGVDLQQDLSRFQILCKIPYPYLGDKLIKKRMYKWKWWYSFTTAKTIIQSVGRSVRSSNDSAVTYIFDSDWDMFYSRNAGLFPEDFKKCIR